MQFLSNKSLSVESLCLKITALMLHVCTIYSL